MDKLKPTKPGLSPFEAVRKRPGMYFGGTDTTAYYYAIFSTIEDYLYVPTAVEPFTLRIVLHTDNSVAIGEDKGLFQVEKDKISEQFEEGARYQLAVTRAASSWMTVDIWQEDQHYKLEFSESKLVSSTINQSKKEEKGSRVRFLLDPNIFNQAEIQIYLHRVLGRVRSWAACFPRVHFQVVSEIDNQANDVQFSNGLSDYLAEYLDGLGGLMGSALHPPLLIEHQNKHGRISLAISWVYMSITNPAIFAFINGNRNHMSGIHIDTLQSSLYKIAKSEYKKTRWAGEDYDVTEDSVFQGLVCGISLWLDNIEISDFSGATRAKLVSPKAQRLVQQAILEKLPDLFIENPDYRDRFISTAATRVKLKI